MPKRELVSVAIKLRKDQVIRLNLLREALAEKMGAPMTLNGLIEKIVDEFLDSK